MLLVILIYYNLKNEYIGVRTYVINRYILIDTSNTKFRFNLKFINRLYFILGYIVPNYSIK